MKKNIALVLASVLGAALLTGCGASVNERPHTAASRRSHNRIQELRNRAAEEAESDQAASAAADAEDAEDKRKENAHRVAVAHQMCGEPNKFKGPDGKPYRNNAFCACVDNTSDRSEWNLVEAGCDPEMGKKRPPSRQTYDEASHVLPIPIPHTYIGVLGTTIPAGYSKATSKTVEATPMEQLPNGNWQHYCHLEFVVDGRAVVWMSNNRPILIQVPHGAGRPMKNPTGGFFEGTSALPPGQQGVMLLADSIQGRHGEIGAEPPALEHTIDIRCWRMDIGLVNPRGHLQARITATLEGESRGGKIETGTMSSPLRLLFPEWFTRTTATPSRALWQ